jgi:hypothetical protein
VTRDNFWVGFLVALIVAGVIAAALGALDTNDWPDEPEVPASVYQHPEEEP